MLSAWYYQPYFAASSVNPNLSLASTPSLDSGTFGIHGIAFAAWTLAAFAIGALAGMLIRRVVPAIAAALAACIGLGLVTALYRYQPGRRFSPFQWIEAGWLIALSVLLIAATVWLVRRRAA